MARLLVTGASGLLGTNLVLEAAGTHAVTAASHRRRVEAPGVEAYQLDLTDEASVRRLLRESRPEWVIHCAAAADVDACERDPAAAMRLNRDMAASVAQAAFDESASFVYISTDAVFDGETGGYDESAAVCPLSVYGRSKLEGERAVLRRHPRAVIARTNIYGWSPSGKISLAEWFLSRCRSGQPSPGWTDVASTPILVNDLSEILLRLLASRAEGLFHVGGATCLSKYEFGRRVASTFGLDPGLIEESRVADAHLPAPRAHRTCLKGEKVETRLELHLPSVDDGLRRFRAMSEDERLDRLKAMLPASPVPSPEGSGP